MPRRTHISVAQKSELRQYYRAHPELTHEDLIRWAQARFSVLLGRSTVGSILRAPKETSLNPMAKRNQEGRYPEMERELYQFVLRSPDLSQLGDQFLCDKANELLQGRQTVTKSWVFRFKQRHAFQALRNLRKIIENYRSQDVFSLDETGIYYQMHPSRQAKKNQEAKISVGLCCNMDGTEKEYPVVIYSVCDGIANINEARVGVKTYANDHAWMTGDNFAKWLHDFNMRMEGRHILLLVDNAPCHGDEVELTNVRVIPFPANSSHLLQPMRAGITQQFKTFVKTLGAQWMLDQQRAASNSGMTAAKMDLLTAVQHITQSWNAVDSQTICSWWTQTGIVSGDMVAQLHGQSASTLSTDTTMLDTLIPLLEPVGPLTSLEYIDAEEDIAEWVPEGLSIDLQPMPRSRRGFQQADQDQKEETDRPVAAKPLSHGEALAAAIKLSTYAFAQGIDVQDLPTLIEITRQRCQADASAPNQR